MIVHLNIVSALAYFITRIFEPHSVYTKKLAKGGHLLTDDKDSNVLMSMNVSDMLEKDFTVLNQSDNFLKLIDAFSKSNRTILPE